MKTELSVRESFSWMTPDMKVNDAPGDKVIVRGLALFPVEKFPIQGISRNKNRYILDEIRRSARTLKNVPVDVNHEISVWEERGKRGAKPKGKGHVLFGEEEDGQLEYAMEVNDKTYAQKYRDTDKVRKGSMTEKQYRAKWGKDPLAGVSVDADFLRLLCVKCDPPREFFDFAEYKDHMWESHSVKDVTQDPRGIVFKRLSIVEPPEVPGVKGTEKWEIVETVQPMQRLYEVLVEDITKRIEYKERTQMGRKYDLQEETTHVAGLPYQKIREQDEAHQCQEGTHWDEEQGTCVPDVEPAQVTEQAPRTDAERAKAHFNLSDEEWDALSHDEKQAYIDKLPPRGSATEQEQHECPEGEVWDAEQGKCVPKTVTEQEQHECPEGEEWSEEEGKCVPKATEQEEHECDEGYHWDSEKGECVKDEPPAQETKLPRVKAFEVQVVKIGKAILEKLTLGEPFADYTSFEDCVSKNQEKDDPEAYCATIKRQVEGETFKEQEEIPAAWMQKCKAYVAEQEPEYTEEEVQSVCVQLYNQESPPTFETAKGLTERMIQKANETLLFRTILQEAQLKKRVNVLRSMWRRRDKETREAINQLIEAVSPLPEGLNKLGDTVNELGNTLNESIAKISESFNEQVKGLDVSETVKKDIQGLQQTLKELKNHVDNIQQTYDTARKDYDLAIHNVNKEVQREEQKTSETIESLEARIAELESSEKQLKEQLVQAAEQTEKKLQETADLASRVEQTETNIENLRAKVKPRFKDQTEPNVAEKPSPAETPVADNPHEDIEKR